MTKEFKLIICGGRDFDDKELLINSFNQVLAELPDEYVVSIVSGMAPGADRLAYLYAKEINCTCYSMAADWDKHGKRAGFIRNADMINVADGVLAFHDGTSKGTAHTIQLAKNKGIYLKVISYVNDVNKAIEYKPIKGASNIQRDMRGE